MKKLSLFLILFSSYFLIQAQPLITRTGHISFFSRIPLENIKAENKQVNAAINLSKQNIAFTALLKGFLFEKALMQEHFNENYVESHLYPKTSFTGSYNGNVNLDENGTYNILVKGNLTLHGITRGIEVPAVMEVRNGKLTGKTNFKIKPADYNIKIPAVVKDKIPQQIDVAVTISFDIQK
jgi:polyisoprenoid-binding protein YceI